MKEVNRNSKVPQYVRRIELLQKRSIMYYQQQTSQPFLKIVVALPTMVTSCRGKQIHVYKHIGHMCTKIPCHLCLNDLQAGKFTYGKILKT